MKKLDFQLDDFTRLLWVSARAREVWEQRINQINGAWSRIERWSVLEGFRGSALSMCEPKDLPEFTEWASRNGVWVLPIARVGANDHYNASPAPIVKGERWQYRIVFTRDQDVVNWWEAWKDDANEGRYPGTQNERIGELLGFPECCRHFFQRIWVDEKGLDTTWPQAIGGGGTLNTFDNSIEIPAGMNRASVLLRWIGVRLVPHLPCSFDCEETIELAKGFAQVGRDRHFGEMIDHIEEMLSWPIEWSALHGIAQIRTPIIKISARTDATGEKYVVRKLGDRYPIEGADGLAFPYRSGQRVQLTGTRSFRSMFPNVHVVEGAAIELSKDVFEATEELERTLADPELQRLAATEERVYGRGPNHWTVQSAKANGFETWGEMADAHERILGAACAIPDYSTVSSVIDFGAGDGRLLERSADLWPSATLIAIESDPERSAAGELRYPAVVHWTAQIQEVDVWPSIPIDVAFFMPGRLLEFKPTDAANVVTALESVRFVVFYAYGDVLRQHGGLEELLAKAGVDDWTRVSGLHESRNVGAIILSPEPADATLSQTTTEGES